MKGLQFRVEYFMLQRVSMVGADRCNVASSEE
jgi:hypothetical protein